MDDANAQKHREGRRLVKEAFAGLFEEVAAILFRDDPMGINFSTNSDEYEPEVGTILPRLSSATNAADVETIIHEEFCRWFGPLDVGVNRFKAVGEEVWAAYCSFTAARREP